MILSAIKYFFKAATIVCCVLSFNTHAPHSSELDTNNPTIKTGIQFLIDTKQETKIHSVLLATTMRLLLLEYHLASAKNEYKDQIEKAVLENDINKLAYGGIHFPLRTTRLILKAHLERLKFANSFDRTIFQRIDKAYEETLDEDKKLMILSTLHAFICIHKFHSDAK